MQKIIGVGCDIVEIERIKKAIVEHASPFLQKIFTDKEIAYCQKFKDPFPSFAARFAAKEAVAKALGCGLGEKLSFKDIEIFHDDHKKPRVRLSDKAKDLFNNPNFEISLSHSSKDAMAYTIAFY
jgi:holo-[acyl-carrier protein] synthase